MSTGNPVVALPLLRLAGAQVAVGAAAIFARFALLGAGPLAVSALRLAIAAGVALLFARNFARLSRRREVAFFAAGGALAVHFAAWIASLEFTSVAISTLLVTTTPIWTELYEVVRERRAPAREYLIALGLAFAGVALIGGQSSAAPPPIPGHVAAGNALALLGSVAIGTYLLIVRAAGRTRGAAPLETRQIVARTYGWSALTLVALAALARDHAPPLADGPAWAGVLGMALISQLLGHTALNAALRDFSPSVIALSTLLEPVVAAILAAAIFHETLTPQTGAGAALVLLAVAATLRAAGK